MPFCFGPPSGLSWRFLAPLPRIAFGLTTTWSPASMPLLTSAIFSFDRPSLMSRSCGPSGVMTNTFRVAPLSAPPMIAWTGMASTFSRVLFTWVVTSALMPGFMPGNDSSSIDTIVEYTLTSEAIQSVADATVATVRTCPRNTRSGNASTRTVAGLVVFVRPILVPLVFECNLVEWQGSHHRGRVHRQPGNHRLVQPGRPAVVPSDPRHHRLVDAGGHLHLGQVGDPHQLLPLLDGRPLLDEPALRLAPAARLRDVVDHHPVLRGRDLALLDLLLDLPELLLLLHVDRSLVLPEGLGLHLVRLRLALG